MWMSCAAFSPNRLETPVSVYGPPALAKIDRGVLPGSPPDGRRCWPRHCLPKIRATFRAGWIYSALSSRACSSRWVNTAAIDRATLMCGPSPPKPWPKPSRDKATPRRWRCAIVEAQPDASQLLLRELAVTARPGGAIAYLNGLLRVRAAGAQSGPLPVDESTVGHQAHAAMALLVLGQPDTLWSLLRQRADPRVRTLLIQRLAGSSLLRPRMQQRLAVPDLDAVERQALLMIWTETALSGVAASAVTDVVNQARRLYLEDPDSGVHSAAELLLRRWKRVDLIEQADRQLRQQPRLPPGRRWEMGPNGHTFAIVAGPLEFWMGSPDHDQDRFPHETRHFRRIERSLAVSTKEVTIEQYRMFKPGFRQETRYSKEANCPANLVNWFDAAAYCNWLSKQDGIDEAEWCYPAQAASGMVVKEGASFAWDTACPRRRNGNISAARAVKRLAPLMWAARSLHAMPGRG